MSSDLRPAASPRTRKFSCSVLRRTTGLPPSAGASVTAQPLESPLTKMLKPLASASLGSFFFFALVSSSSRALGSLGSVQMATPVTTRGEALGNVGGIGVLAIVTEFLTLARLRGSSSCWIAFWAAGRISSLSGSPPSLVTSWKSGTNVRGAPVWLLTSYHRYQQRCIPRPGTLTILIRGAMNLKSSTHSPPEVSAWTSCTLRWGLTVTMLGLLAGGSATNGRATTATPARAARATSSPGRHRFPVIVPCLLTARRGRRRAYRGRRGLCG